MLINAVQKEGGGEKMEEERRKKHAKDGCFRQYDNKKSQYDTSGIIFQNKMIIEKRG